MADISKIVLPDNTEYEIKDTKARMIILSYGHSTWTDFISAYQNNQVIYCRASSNSNPATGSQTRLAFMAYVSNADTPTNVEFQYYRSMNKHTDAQQGDQVFVYKLTNANKWTVTVRNAFSKVIAGDNISSTFVESETTSSITLNADYDSTVTSGSTKLITSGAVADAIPTVTSDLTNDSNFVSDANYVHTDNNFTTAEQTKLSGIETGAEVNVQADWGEASSSSDAYIQNKPTALSAFTNDSDYQTGTQVDTKLADKQDKTILCTQSQFDTWLNTSFPYTDCNYIITDAPNTNGTSEDLSYDGGVTSTHDVINSMFYHIGDKLYLAGSCYSGRLTGSSTAITVFIPFNKILDSNITGATINGDFTVYGYDGNVQITNSSSTGEWTTLTVLEHGVLGVFTLSTAITLTNGRPINVMFTASASSSKYVQFS